MLVTFHFNFKFYRTCFAYSMEQRELLSSIPVTIMIVTINLLRFMSQ